MDVVPPLFVKKSSVLGLLLTYYSDQSGHKSLSRMFDIPPVATLSRYLIKGEVA